VAGDNYHIFEIRYDDGMETSIYKTSCMTLDIAIFLAKDFARENRGILYEITDKNGRVVRKLKAKKY